MTSVPPEKPAYSPRQEAALNRLAQLIADNILQREADKQLAREAESE